MNRVRNRNKFTIHEMSIPFTKLHGLGNDFVLLDLRARTTALRASRALQSRSSIQKIGDRKRGVGFDQLLVLRSPEKLQNAEKAADAQLEIFNTDGSRAEMCGNGVRAAALYLWRRGKLTHKPVCLQTDVGLRTALLIHPRQKLDGEVQIECDMDVPGLLSTPKLLRSGVKIAGKAQWITCVDVGNPHAVLFYYPKEMRDLEKWGAFFEQHRAFPNRTNVEFVRVRSKNAVDVLVWERGVGITEACGSGAIAAAVSAIMNALARSPVQVHFPGGVAQVRWDGPGTPAFLTGTAEEVYSGEWNFQP